jgi:patatin-like phospholipase/acyl hydrolase
MKNILSIDGGGVRSYLTLKILNEIERRTNTPISELFDYFTGVSAGSLVASLLLVKADNGLQKYSTSDILEIFQITSSSIFYNTYWNNIWSVFGLLGPKYSNKEFQKALLEYFGEVSIKNLCKPICILSYDINNQMPYYFTTSETGDMLVKDCILASTAAPTYFYPYKIGSEQYVDGGVVTNNPAEICFLKARESDNLSNYFTLSLATGYSIEPAEKSFGLLGWSTNILNTLFNATSASQNIELDILDKLLPGDNKFQRIDIPLSKYISLDDTSSFPIMKLLMDNWIAENTTMIDDLCSTLVANKAKQKEQSKAG